MPQQISFIGLGMMGKPIARNVRKSGYELFVYNRSASKAEALVAEGAKLGKTPFEVVEPGGIVMTIRRRRARRPRVLQTGEEWPFLARESRVLSELKSHLG